MKTTTLGRSGLHVSRIAFGTWQLGLDPRLFLEAIADGPLASDYAMTKGAAMLDAEFTPGFPLRHATEGRRTRVERRSSARGGTSTD